MKLPPIRCAIFGLGMCALSGCSLPFDECLIEGRCDGGTGGARSCDPSSPEDWLVTFGGDGNQMVSAVAVDGCDGDAVVVGATSAAMTLQPSGENAAAGDLFVARIRADASTRFVAVVDATGGASAFDVAIDSDGSAIVVGELRGSADFGGELASSAGAMADAFVAAYSPSGAVRWVRTFGGDGHDDARAVAIDPGDGHVFVTGTHSPGASFFGETPATSDGDLYVLRLSPAGDAPAEGNRLWRMAGAGVQAGHALAVDDNRFYVAGTFFEELDSLVDAPTAGLAGSNGFVAGFAKDGGFLWRRTVMGDGEELAPRVALAAGSVIASVNVDGDISTGCNMHSASTGAIIVSGFDSAGGDCTTWRPLGGPGDDRATGLAVDGAGNPVVAGTYTDNMVTPDLDAEDSADIFVVALAGGETPVGAVRIAADGPADDAGGVAFGPGGARVLVGAFSDRIAQGNDAFDSDDGLDGFVMLTSP